MGHPLGVAQVRMVPSLGEFEHEGIVGQLASVHNDRRILDEAETSLIALVLKGIER